MNTYDFIVTFLVSAVDIGCRFSIRTYLSWDVKLKYSDMGYLGISRCCVSLQVGAML